MNEKVEELSLVNFGVSNCPKPVFDKFKAFCDGESHRAGFNFVSYPLGLKLLLDLREVSAREDFIFGKITELNNQLAGLNGRIAELESKGKKPVGFGGIR